MEFDQAVIARLGQPEQLPAVYYEKAKHVLEDKKLTIIKLAYLNFLLKTKNHH